MSTIRTRRARVSTGKSHRTVGVDVGFSVGSSSIVFETVGSCVLSAAALVGVVVVGFLVGRIAVGFLVDFATGAAVVGCFVGFPIGCAVVGVLLGLLVVGSFV